MNYKVIYGKNDLVYTGFLALPGKQIIIKGSTNTTDMQCTRWTWGKTHSYFSICHVLFYS